MKLDGANFDIQNRRPKNVDRESYQPWGSDGSIPAGTRPTVDSNYLSDQEADRRKAAVDKEEEKVARRAERAARKRAARLNQVRQELSNLRQPGAKLTGQLSNNARALRTISASAWAAAICLSFYFYQLIFWILLLIGLGLEADALSMAELFDLNTAEKVALWIGSTVLPGQAFFLVGWVVSSLIAIIQILIVWGLYALRRVNPFRHISLVTFIGILAGCLMPLGIIPWAHIWILMVLRDAKN